MVSSPGACGRDRAFISSALEGGSLHRGLCSLESGLCELGKDWKILKFPIHSLPWWIADEINLEMIGIEWICPFFSSTKDDPSCPLSWFQEITYAPTWVCIHACMFMAHVSLSKSVYSNRSENALILESPPLSCVSSHWRWSTNSFQVKQYWILINCFRGSETSWVPYGSVCKQNRILPVGEQFLQVTHCDHRASCWRGTWREHGMWTLKAE